MTKKLPKDKSLGVTAAQSALLEIVNEDITRTFGAKTAEELSSNLEYMNDTDLRDLCFRVGVSVMGSKASLKERISNAFESQVRRSIGSLHQTNPEPIKVGKSKKEQEELKRVLAQFD